MYRRACAQVIFEKFEKVTNKEAILIFTRRLKRCDPSIQEQAEMAGKNLLNEIYGKEILPAGKP